MKELEKQLRDNPNNLKDQAKRSPRRNVKRSSKCESLLNIPENPPVLSIETEKLKKKKKPESKFILPKIITGGSCGGDSSSSSDQGQGHVEEEFTGLQED